MNMTFQLGVIIATVILIKLHIAIGFALMIMGYQISDWGIVLQIMGFIYLAATAIGHMRCSKVVFGEMHDPNLLNESKKAPETFKEATLAEVQKDKMFMGMVWRFSREVDFVQKTIKLDFKTPD